MPKEPHIYGEPLTGLFSTLRNLRMKYKEYDRGVYAEHRIEIPDFAVRIKIGESEDPFRTENDGGWANLFYDKHGSTPYDVKFREHLFLTLVERGYLAFLRTSGSGNDHIYRQLLISNNWGRIIIDRRLDAWSRRVDRAFLFRWTKNLVDTYSIPELIDRHPGFFDYLSY